MVLVKYADDTYLIIPADNIQICYAEIANIETRKLGLHQQFQVKPCQVDGNSLCSSEKQASSLDSITVSLRVESIKPRCHIQSKIFAHTAIDELLTSCAQSLFALHTLCQHGLPTEGVHAVFQAIVVNKLSYASPAWWWFTSADDWRRLETFVCHSVTPSLSLYGLS